MFLKISKQHGQTFIEISNVHLNLYQLQGDQQSPGIIPLAVKDAFTIIQDVCGCAVPYNYFIFNINILTIKVVNYLSTSIFVDS